MNQLEHFQSIAPVIFEIFKEDDAMIAISNEKEILRYKPGFTIDIAKEGDEIARGDGLYEAIETGKLQRVYVPKEVKGFPFRAVTSPLFDENNQVIGAFGIG